MNTVVNFQSRKLCLTKFTHVQTKTGTYVKINFMAITYALSIQVNKHTNTMRYSTLLIVGNVLQTQEPHINKLKPPFNKTYRNKNYLKYYLMEKKSQIYEVHFYKHILLLI